MSTPAHRRHDISDCAYRTVPDGAVIRLQSTRTEYVPLPPILIPAHLLTDCLPPAIPDIMTWSDSLILNEQLLTVIEQCTLDKRAIREIEKNTLPLQTNDAGMAGTG
ncbi:Rz1-like lysis system protein LysC [Xenorhabdus taiwanensis]|uniref:Rz1-like lysis system protein LysC n=1 Tax=Xenorhabdus taiwanensis TaxID=3085177 RepID=UPI0035A5C691